MCRTGSLTSLHLIYSKESCCSFPQMNGLPFLVKSYIGFNNFCSSGQNILRKLTIPMKLLQPFTVVGSFSFCTASNILHKGCTHTLLFCINISFLVKSYIGFNNFCSSGQNILRKLTIPMKLLQPFTVVGSFSFCTASNILHKGCTHTLLFCINISLAIYCNLF